MTQDILVLNTRPERQAKPLTNKITRLGAKVIECPSLKIIGLDRDVEKINKNKFKNDDVIIFTSANAVYFYFKKSMSNIKQNTVIAIGPATQAALLERKIYAICPKTFNSSGILKMTELRENKNITIITGYNPKKQLHSCLQETGHKVTLIEAYKRIINNDSITKIKNITKLDYILISSRDSLIALNQLIIESGKIELKTAAIITINIDVRKLAIKLGFNDNIIVSKDATDASLENCIKEIIDHNKLKD